MTPPNTDNTELGKIIRLIEEYARGFDVGCPDPSIEDIKQAIQAHLKQQDITSRIDELEIQFIQSHWARLCREVNSWAKYVDRRIDELRSLL